MRARLLAASVGAGSGGVIGGAGATLVFGGQLPGWMTDWWASVSIVLVVLIVAGRWKRERDRATIRVQRAVIRQFTEMAYEMFRDG